MKAKLVYIHSPDALNLDSYFPEDVKCFGILVQAMFGEESLEGEESFDFMLCTSSWLEIQVKKNGIVNGRHHIIVEEFNFALIKQYIIDFAQQCTGETWDEVAQKLSRLGKWEFEDYKPYGSVS